MKKNKKTYFKIGKSEAIYPAKTSIRALARLFDYFLAILPGILVSSIFIAIVAPSIGVNSLNEAALGLEEEISNISTFLKPFKFNVYEPVVLTGQSLMILGIIGMLIVFPMLNRKHFGQTLGKKLFKITPIYLNERAEWKSFTIRETFIATPLILMITFSMISGVSGATQLGIYQQVVGFSHEELSDNTVWFIDQLPKTNSEIKFLLEIYSNPIFFDVSKGLAIMTIVANQAILVTIILLILVFITVLVSKQKMGPHDMIASTSIVDLNSIIEINDAVINHDKISELDNPFKNNSNPFGPPNDNHYGPK